MEQSQLRDLSVADWFIERCPWAAEDHIRPEAHYINSAKIGRVSVKHPAASIPAEFYDFNLKRCSIIVCKKRE